MQQIMNGILFRNEIMRKCELYRSIYGKLNPSIRSTGQTFLIENSPSVQKFFLSKSSKGFKITQEKLQAKRIRASAFLLYENLFVAPQSAKAPKKAFFCTPQTTSLRRKKIKSVRHVFHGEHNHRNVHHFTKHQHKFAMQVGKKTVLILDSIKVNVSAIMLISSEKQMIIHTKYRVEFRCKRRKRRKCRKRFGKMSFFSCVCFWEEFRPKKHVFITHKTINSPVCGHLFV